MSKKDKKKRTKEYWCGLADGIVIVILLGFAIYLIWFFFPGQENFSGMNNPSGIDSIVDECSNKTIIGSAHCVRDITGTFFKLNISNVDKNIDFETLKKEGGLCEAWTDYWCKIGNKFGYYTKKVEIGVGYINLTYEGVYDEYEMGHVFCIWSNSDAYVKLDMMYVDEVEFNDSFFEGAVIE